MRDIRKTTELTNVTADGFIELSLMTSRRRICVWICVCFYYSDLECL